MFRYAVQSGDADSDGFDVSENGLAPGGGTIRGLDGGTALLAHAGVEGGDGHRIAGSLAALTGGICGRTPQVRAAILARAQANDETVETCADVSGTHLKGLTGTLDLDGLGSTNRIASLKAGDFAGLTGIVRLDLDNNRLRTVPAGVFDEMTALTGLSMSWNQAGAADSLMTLPVGLFDKLTKLTSLGLAHNDLKTLPPRLFQNLTELESLALDGNPGSAGFVPLAKAGPEGGLDAVAGTEVKLGAEGAEDGPGDPWGTNVTYSWTQVSGETVELSATDAAQPTFTVPASAEASELVFELAVAGRGATGSNAHRATRRLTVRVGAGPVGPAVTDVSIVSAPREGDTYRRKEMIEVAVTFDGTVRVDTADGTPTIQLSASFEGVSGYVRGSGTNRLVFAYTVQAADTDSDGIGVLQSKLRLNGGMIVASEEPGANAQLLYAGVAASSSHKVDGDGTPALIGGVCERTPQIRDALVAKVSAASDCSEVTNAYLAAITGTLNLDGIVTGSRMTGLKAGDFEGLSGVTVLHLSNNPSAGRSGGGVRSADGPDGAVAERQRHGGGRRADAAAGGAVRRSEGSEDPEPVRQRPRQPAAAPVREADRSDPVGSRQQPRQRQLPAAREGRPRGGPRRGGGHDGDAGRRGAERPGRPGRPVGRERQVFMDPARRRGGPAHEREDRAADLHGAGFGGRHDPDLPAQGPGLGLRQ